MSHERISILGVSFDLLRQDEVLLRMSDFQKGNDQKIIVTPNPEICLLAHSDATFRRLLNQANISVPDGFGILWADRFLQGKKSWLRIIGTLMTPGKTRALSRFSERVTGTDLMQEFCQRFPESKVFLLGASQEVNQRLAKTLHQQFGTRIVGAYSGSPKEEEEALIRQKIVQSGAEVLFVAFGAPRQEQWIFRNLKLMPNVKMAMGVGGAFDFLAGERKRAPRWMRAAGLEWLYRVMIEPSRIKRILNATLVFPWKVKSDSK